MGQTWIQVSKYDASSLTKAKYLLFWSACKGVLCFLNLRPSGMRWFWIVLFKKAVWCWSHISARLQSVAVTPSVEMSQLGYVLNNSAVTEVDDPYPCLEVCETTVNCFFLFVFCPRRIDLLFEVKIFAPSLQNRSNLVRLGVEYKNQISPQISKWI